MIKIRKHFGINKKTGKLKKGFKYSGKKLKSGIPQIIKTQKYKQKTGGKYISRGTYGCAVTPAYQCPELNVKNLDKKISKLSPVNFEQVPKIFAKLYKIDPNNKYFIYPTDFCNIPRNIIDKKDLQLCTKDKDGIDLSHHKVFNSIMKKGKNNLDKYRSTKLKINKATFFLKTILDAIQILTNNNIIHLDIKSGNILELNGKIFIIDFDDYFNPTDINGFKNFLDLDYQTYVWPPEVYMQLDEAPRISNEIKQYIKQTLNKRNYKKFIQKIMIYSTGLMFKEFLLSGKKETITEFKELIETFLNDNPQKRPTIKQALKQLQSI